MLIYAITGSEMTGKTSLAYEIAHLLYKKQSGIRVHIVPEVTMDSNIENSIGLVYKQLWQESMLFHLPDNRVKPPDIVLLDRTSFDCVTYVQPAKYPKILRHTIETVKAWSVNYKRIFNVVEPLHSIPYGNKELIEGRTNIITAILKQIPSPEKVFHIYKNADGKTADIIANLIIKDIKEEDNG